MATRAGKSTPLTAMEHDANLGFPTVAALLADPIRTHSVGEILRAAGFAYRVVSSGQHLTTAGGTKLAVMPESDGLFPLGAWGITEATANIGPTLQTAFNAVHHLRFPNGTYTLNSDTFLDEDGTCSLVGSENTTLILAQVSGNIYVRSGTRAQSLTLASNIARGGNSFTVASVGGLQVGDLIYFEGGEVVETGWGNRKKEMCRVQAISDTTITADQPFDFPWNTTDAPLTVHYSRTVRANVRNINFVMPGGGDGFNNKIQFAYNSGTVVENCTWLGPTPFWTGATWADGLHITQCDNMTVQHVRFKDCRYIPLINNACRNITLRHFVAEGIRHVDCNGWSKDTVFEDGIGISSHCLIQSHPAIRTVFRRVKDNVVSSTLRGFSIRSFGFLVEDCVSNSSIEALAIGSDTQRLLLTPNWREFAKNFDRTFVRFKSNKAVPLAQQANLVQFYDCDVPGISGTNTGDALTNSVYVSPDTKLRVPKSGSLSRIRLDNRGLVHRVVPVNDTTHQSIWYRDNPAIGNWPKSHFIAKMFGETEASATTHAFPFRIYPVWADTGGAGTRHCEIIVRAITVTGMAETTYRFRYTVSSGAGTDTAATELADRSYAFGSVTAALSTRVISLLSLPEADRYFGFTIDVTVPIDTALRNVELEVIERPAFDPGAG